jgi:hypothetical protein
MALLNVRQSAAKGSRSKLLGNLQSVLLSSRKTNIKKKLLVGLVGFMVFNATFNNISVTSLQSVFLVEEAGVSGENHQPATSHWQTFKYHIMLYTSPWAGFKLTTLVVICTDWTSSCKSNYHTITTMMAPQYQSFHLIKCCSTSLLR